jgi:hypothetical protein
MLVPVLLLQESVQVPAAAVAAANPETDICRHHLLLLSALLFPVVQHGRQPSLLLRLSWTSALDSERQKIRAVVGYLR